QDAGALAGVRLAPAGAAVREIAEDGDGLIDDASRWPALDVDDEPDPAGIVLERRVVETLLLGELVSVHGHLPTLATFRAFLRAAGSGSTACPAPFLGSLFLETSFLETSFLETSFLEATFLEATFLEATFLETSLLETSFLAAPFLAAPFLAARRRSMKPRTMEF